MMGMRFFFRAFSFFGIYKSLLRFHEKRYNETSYSGDVYMHILKSGLIVVIALLSFQVFGQEAKVPVPKQPNLRVVDYGSDLGTGIYRNHMPEIFRDVEVDADGDGETKDDSVSGWKFSLEVPFNPTGDAYNTQAPSHTYYGGIIGYHANQPYARITEGMLNENHELRDDANMMSNQQASAKKAGNTVQAWGVWLWKKDDFLNHGNDHAVTFDDQSLLALHVSRYWDDVDGGRWVVQDGDDFYISEATFGTAEDIKRRGEKTRLTWMQHPTKTRWAVYTPEAPYDIRFDAAKAVFKEHALEDVTATGFYIFKDSKTEAVVSVKWYAFETYANVDVPDMLSLHLDMDEIKEGDADFAVSKTTLSYEKWIEVYNWAVSNQYATGLDQRGYVFDRDGDMGNMDIHPEPVNALEPVTDVTYRDAILWCNALSKLEGLTPCYYEDAEYKKVLRKIRERDYPEKYGWVPDIYLKSDANGYRLPVASELTEIKNLLDGPSEFFWNESDGVLSADAESVPAIVGNIKREMLENAFYKGGASPYVSFRAVRLLEGEIIVSKKVDIANEAFMLPVAGNKAKAPQKRVALPDNFLSEVKDGQYLRNDGANVTVSDYKISRTEIPYWFWDAVYQEALPMGYDFDHDGDMGSMDWNPGEKKHSPDEPVTDIGWYDALVWCNALSELTGHTPCYYADEEKTQVLRSAHPWRIRMVPEGYGADQTKEVKVYTKWEADGFRLPTWAEWYIALRADDDNYEGRKERQWTAENSGERTHAVGTSKANPWGIYDLQGNVSEWLHDIPVNDYYRSHNPKGDQRDNLFGITIAGARYLSEASHNSGRSNEKNRKSAAWPWLGFRVVRCEANAHTNAPFVPKVVLDVDAENFDPLQGRAFRANMRRNGVFEAAGLPELKGVKWKVKTGGAVLSSPVVVDGIVYIGSDDGYFYALDAADGSEKWKFDTGGKVQGSAVVGRDGTVYIGSRSGYLFALDGASGEEKWKYGFDERNPKGKPAVTSPALAFGTVFCAFDQWGGAYVGVDAKSGEKVWQLRRFVPNGGLLGPTIDGTTFYAPVNDNVIVAADIRTEMPLDDFDRNGHHCQASIAIQGDRLFYSQGPSLKIKNKTDGKKLAELFIRGDGLSFFPQSGPAATEERAWVAKGNKTLYCLDLTDMRALPKTWTLDLPAQVRSSLALAENTLYYGCDDGHVYALDATSGAERWKFKTEGPVASSPWLSDGALYVGSEDGFIYALE